MEDIVLFDGAVGTGLWEKTDNKVPVWRYNAENTAIVSQLHKEYLDAGAQYILANTFNANRMNMKDTPYNVKDIVTSAMNLVHDAVQDKAKISLSIGPLSELLEPYGDLTEEDAYEIFDEQISWGVEGKPDAIYLQTFMDVEMIRIAARAAAKHNLPIFASMSFDKTGHTMMGNTPKDMAERLKDLPITAIGLNCSVGPETAVPVMKMFREATDLPLIFKPNAGKPTVVNGVERVQFDIETFVKDSLPALEYGVKYIGGCCGSNARYIKALGEAIRNL